MKVFEYMAMGKPVVAPRFGPLAEVISDGAEGFLFTPSAGREMADALGRLLDDSPLRLAMGERGRATVLARHTWQRNVEKILDVAGRISENWPTPGKTPSGRVSCWSSRQS
jgi:glycosyltransferase involved in cell wall biosynthesis